MASARARAAPGPSSSRAAARAESHTHTAALQGSAGAPYQDASIGAPPPPSLAIALKWTFSLNSMYSVKSKWRLST